MANFRSGFCGPTDVPFDDIFSSLPIVNQTLEDDFYVFLKTEDYLPRMNDNSWVQREYAEHFGQINTFAHHDMRLDTNQEKFRRRVDRFRALKALENPLFVSAVQTGALTAAQVLRLRSNLDRLFGRAGYLLIGLGDPPQSFDVAESDRLYVRFYRPLSETDGVTYRDPNDNTSLISIIREVADLTAAYSPA